MVHATDARHGSLEGLARLEHIDEVAVVNLLFHHDLTNALACFLILELNLFGFVIVWCMML